MNLEAELARLSPVAALQGVAKVMSAPLFWHDQTRSLGKRVLHSGTCCLVNTGRRLIGVTACHVYDQYVADQASVANLDCQLGRTLFDPIAHLIDRHEQLDLATFSLDEATIRNCGGAAHQPAKAWPPSPPSLGSRVMLGGFPADFRCESPDTIHHAFASIFTTPENSSPSSISLSLDLNNDIAWPEETVLVPGTELGGASGGPLLAVQERPVIAWSLAGVLHEYQASLEIVMARPVSHIAADGMLIP